MPGLTVEPFPEVRYGGAFAALRGDFARVAPFFAYPPAEPASYRARAAAVDGAWSGAAGRRRRQAVAEALVRYVEAIGGSPAQRAAAASLAAPETLAVVTGQQAGLLGGPLLTVYKAITAVRLAERWQAELGRPVVPVFWIASEDHDFAEVNLVRGVDADGRPARLRLPPLPNRRSIGDIPVPVAARRLVAGTVGLLPAGAARPDAVAWLEGTLEASLQRRESLAGWFARLLAQLFADRGLVLLDPMLPELRALAAPVVQQAWARAEAVNGALADAATRLRAAGFEPGLALEPDHLHVFHTSASERVALFHRGAAGVVSRNGDVALTPAEFERLVREQPHRFSPGVVLRPVVQDAILPTLCQVSGPGEAAYLSQMRDVFPLFGQAMPVIFPRLGATLALPGDERAAADLGVALGALQGEGWRQALGRAIAARSRLDVAARFATERDALRARYDALADDLARGVAPPLRELAARNCTYALRQLDYLERKARQHERRRERELVRRVTAAAERLFPAGRLQESVMSAAPYLLACGLELVRELAAAADIDATHLLIRLTTPA